MLGVLALLAVGGIQTEQYTVARYSVIPTIGELFLATSSPRARAAALTALLISRCC